MSSTLKSGLFVTRHQFTEKLFSWPTAIGAVVGLLIAALSLSGFARTADLHAERDARIAADTSIRNELHAKQSALDSIRGDTRLIKCYVQALYAGESQPSCGLK